MIKKKKINKQVSVFYRTKNTDLKVIKNIFNKNEYFLEGFVLKNLKYIIDLGAHIGIFSFYVKSKFPNAKIYAYEPNPETYKLLKQNIKLNKLKNIKTFKRAVSGKKGLSKFYIHNKSNWEDNLYVKAKKQGREIKVKTITLKDIFDENKIKKCDLLKIDVEGTEYEILNTFPKQYFNKINLIILETHNFVFPKNTEKIIKILSKRGFKICNISHSEKHGGVILAKKSLFNYPFLLKFNKLKYEKATNATNHKIFYFIDKYIGKIGKLLRRMS